MKEVFIQTTGSLITVLTQLAIVHLVHIQLEEKSKLENWVKSPGKMEKEGHLFEVSA